MASDHVAAVVQNRNPMGKKGQAFTVAQEDDDDWDQDDMGNLANPGAGALTFYNMNPGAGDGNEESKTGMPE